jgi:hypothetical protein
MKLTNDKVQTRSPFALNCPDLKTAILGESTNRRNNLGDVCETATRRLLVFANVLFATI